MITNLTLRRDEGLVDPRFLILQLLFLQLAQMPFRLWVGISHAFFCVSNQREHPILDKSHRLLCHCRHGAKLCLRFSLKTRCCLIPLDGL